MNATSPTPDADAKSLTLSLLFCTLTVFGFVVGCERVAHWFVIPVWVCGILIGRDAMDWIRGRVDLFAPSGIIGLLGVHVFFLAPLLHVGWDSWLEPWYVPPREWRDWLGGMAVLNAVGLLLYSGARERATKWGGSAATKTHWEVNHRRIVWLALFGLLFSGVLQCWVYARFGGIAGYIQSVTDSIGGDNAESSMAGMGWTFMFSESFPIVAMILFAVCARRSPRAQQWLVIILVLVVYFALKMFFGGLRGSRSNTIWGLFWAVGIIHLWLRPITRKFVFGGLCFLVVFMYAYGFYKERGRDVVRAFEEGSLTDKSQRTFRGMLLGDLGRADVHAYLLHRLWKPDSDYQYAWGRTYVGSAALLIPSAIWPGKPPLKIKDGTEAFYGAGTYDEGKWYSSKVYGIAGEAMLNFGPLVVPFAYLLFGLIVGRLQHFLSILRADDTRLLLCPLLVNSCFSILLSDSDNLIFNFIKDGLVPIAIVCLGSHISAGWKMAEAGIPAGGFLPETCGGRRPAEAVRAGSMDRENCVS